MLRCFSVFVYFRELTDEQRTETAQIQISMQIYLLQYLVTDVLICVTVAESKNVFQIFIASFGSKTTAFLTSSTLSELLFFFNGIHEPLLRGDISRGCPDR